MQENSKNTVSPQKDGLALVVGGLFILALVFAAYNYFSKGTNIEDKSLSNEKSAQEVVESTKEEKTETGKKGSINGDGAKDIKTEEDIAGTKTDTTVIPGDLGKGGSILVWIANNYNLGEIKGGSYTVRWGDTLWEISEGVYGNGLEWFKILTANKSTVGFLPNGVQALIYEGQTLVLP